MVILDWLNHNEGAVVAIATVVIAIATFVLVLVTRYYAKETKRSRIVAENSLKLTEQAYKSTSKPEIVLTLHRDMGNLNVCIKNVGHGVAKTIRIKAQFSKRLLIPKNARFPPVLETSFDRLVSMQRYVYTLMQTGINRSFLDGHLPVNFMVTYSVLGEEKEDIFEFDYATWSQIPSQMSDPSDDIVVQLKHISSELSDIRHEIRRIR